MKYFIVLYCVFSITIIHAQNPYISNELPTIIPPSPTVAALMKYEEIPVSTYTGIPNISIPLFNFKFPSHDIAVNVGLSYHAASTKVDELASDIGLGWSLTGGGSISRSVRGMPDEKLATNKYGMYRTNSVNGINYYQIVQSMQNNGYLNIMSPMNIVGSATPDNIKEYLWETNAKGQYDTQHDLWQYNFNGHTGRFYIEKQAYGGLEVKLLENTTLKIINHYISTNHTNPFEHYKPTGFTVYDDKGYKYIFDVVEKSTTTGFTQMLSQNDQLSMNPVLVEEYESAFHLSKIVDSNNKLLVEYKYTNAGEEHIQNSSLTSHYPEFNVDIAGEIDHVLEHFAPLYGQNFLLSLYKPKTTVSSSGVVYMAKKISEIKVIGSGKVLFNYQQGRLDENYTNRANVKILKGIVVKDTSNVVIKNYVLEHEYKEAIETKLFLKEVVQTKDNDAIDVYKLFYKEPTVPIGIYAKDYWGYVMNNGHLDYGLVKEADKDFVAMFALEKMVLPTGGCVVFEYESNTYSYQGTEQLTNFDENYYNWDFKVYSRNLIGRSSPVAKFFTIDVDQKVFFQTSTNYPVNSYFFSIYKEDPENSQNPPTLAGAITELSVLDSNGYSFLNLEAGTYRVQFYTPEFQTGYEPSPFSSSIAAYYRTKKIIDYKNYFYGGGFRIATIATYDQNVNTSHNTLTPQTQKHYSYVPFENNNNASSGVLVSKKPVFRYQTSMFRPTLGVVFQGTTAGIILLGVTHGYDVFTNFDRINRGKTKGADIGYKNVTVSSLNNGRSEYTYTTSLEYPNIENSIADLYLPPINMDHKRGLIKKEETFDNLNKKLITKVYDYAFEDNMIMTGLHVFGTYDGGYNDCPNFKLFTNYGDYKTQRDSLCNPMKLACSVGNYYDTFRVNLNIGYSALVEAYGWSKLVSSNTKEYFYPPNSSTPSIVETTETYSYNSTNKKIAENTAITSDGEILKTNYYYHTENSIHSQNRISEIERVETYRNNELLSTSKINYTNDWGTNVSYLPQTIQSSKGANALETKVRYNKYDDFSNPLEVQQENGTKISYIWGYHHTQPVAKIENIAYNSIPSNLITAIHNATTESAMLSALTALRNHSTLANAMVTTYTYLPLVGIKTITDPKGYTTTYHYDNFNRLEKVTDMENNILSENQYRYRTQN